MIECLSCGNTEPVGSVFCSNCGKSLAPLQPPLSEGKGPGHTGVAERLSPPAMASDPEAALEKGFGYQLLHSKPAILAVAAPQAHFLLLDLFAAGSAASVRPNINLCVIIDRSTSMKGVRLEQVKHATISIIEALAARDRVSIISFSDRAETVLKPDESRRVNLVRSRLSLMKASGGTEIAQGLRTGLDELYTAFSSDGVNHILLLTDGRTYGDEGHCREMADEAAQRGVTLNAIGIGHDWSDEFLDDLAQRTGGQVAFLDKPAASKELLGRIFDSLEHIAVNNIQLHGIWQTGVDLRSAYRLSPEPMPLGGRLPLKLGPLPGERRLSVLLELEVAPAGETDRLPLAQLSLTGDVIALDENASVELEVALPVSREAEGEPTPREISDALGALTLYRMQEKARQDAAEGKIMAAVRRLETLATNLEAIDQQLLAHSALEEAKRLIRSTRFSDAGSKMLKYGTRTLLLMARTEEE
jgi:Ca-activated chloride channel family protein